MSSEFDRLPSELIQKVLFSLPSREIDLLETKYECCRGFTDENFWIQKIQHKTGQIVPSAKSRFETVERSIVSVNGENRVPGILMCRAINDEEQFAEYILTNEIPNVLFHMPDEDFSDTHPTFASEIVLKQILEAKVGWNSQKQKILKFNFPDSQHVEFRIYADMSDNGKIYKFRDQLVQEIYWVSEHGLVESFGLGWNEVYCEESLALIDFDTTNSKFSLLTPHLGELERLKILGPLKMHQTSLNLWSWYI